jgi:hypothetical protein
MKWSRMVIGVLCASVFTGCAMLKVTYVSDPPGALIVERNGSLRGTSPRTGTYVIPAEALAAGRIHCSEVTAYWPDGSSKSVSASFDISKCRAWTYTISKDKSLTVIYDSYPLGAAIYEGEVSRGIAPFTGRYEVKEGKEQGFFLCRPVTARWVSGAEATVQVNHDLKTGFSTSRTLQRPMDAPNLELDLSYSLERERVTREGQQQAFEQEQIRRQAREAQKRYEQDRTDQGLQNLQNQLWNLNYQLRR